MADKRVVEEQDGDRKVTVTFRKNGSYWIRFSDDKPLVIESTFLQGKAKHSIIVAPKKRKAARSVSQ
jgi:hypothetical protein